MCGAICWCKNNNWTSTWILELKPICSNRPNTLWCRLCLPSLLLIRLFRELEQGTGWWLILPLLSAISYWRWSLRTICLCLSRRSVAEWRRVLGLWERLSLRNNPLAETPCCFILKYGVACITNLLIREQRSEIAFVLTCP